jgi:hypothetical protein
MVLKIISVEESKRQLVTQGRHEPYPKLNTIAEAGKKLVSFVTLELRSESKPEIINGGTQSNF